MNDPTMEMVSCLSLIIGIVAFILLISCAHHLSGIDWRLKQILWIAQCQFPPPPVAKPPPLGGKLCFRAEGIDSTTGEKTTCTIKATSEIEAYKIARKRLAEVTKIEPAPA